MDERTFARTAEQYAARLYAVAYRLLGNRSDAEDAVQRALLKAYEAREAYSSRWAVSTWLYRVLTNVCIDELRPAPAHSDPSQLPRARAGTAVERLDLRARSTRCPARPACCWHCTT
jgi:RNA polymerase sigma-70 factor (ECF subfamily)